MLLNDICWWLWLFYRVILKNALTVILNKFRKHLSLLLENRKRNALILRALRYLSKRVCWQRLKFIVGYLWRLIRNLLYRLWSFFWWRRRRMTFLNKLFPACFIWWYHIGFVRVWDFDCPVWQVTCIWLSSWATLRWVELWGSIWIHFVRTYFNFTSLQVSLFQSLCTELIYIINHNSSSISNTGKSPISKAFGRTKLPYLSSAWKYFTPFTVPLLVPKGSSSLTPT